MTFKDFDRT